MEEFAVFKSMENDLEEKHPHKVVAIHKGKIISKKFEIVGRNLFGIVSCSTKIEKNILK
ncbi:MAG: hypothetical protein ISS94_04740 [Candidatus Syntrophoarchaeum sp.]|nr:hypothetical protein [Candidatus Syntrophoarchaeum sp.]